MYLISTEGQIHQNLQPEKNKENRVSVTLEKIQSYRSIFLNYITFTLICTYPSFSTILCLASSPVAAKLANSNAAFRLSFNLETRELSFSNILKEFQFSKSAKIHFRVRAVTEFDNSKKRLPSNLGNFEHLHNILILNQVKLDDIAHLIENIRAKLILRD